MPPVGWCTLPPVGERPSDSEVRAALRAYFAVLQSNPTAEEMRRRIVTDDFETGFVGGYLWRGPDSLRDFLAARAGFVDEQHDVDEVLQREDLSSGEVRIKTRLEFSLRQPDSNQLLTGTAFHTWRLRRDDTGRLRVAAQLVDRLADLNDNAQRLFATPDQGLNPMTASRHLALSRLDCPERRCRSKAALTWLARLGERACPSGGHSTRRYSLRQDRTSWMTHPT